MSRVWVETTLLCFWARAWVGVEPVEKWYPESTNDGNVCVLWQVISLLSMYSREWWVVFIHSPIPSIRKLEGIHRRRRNERALVEFWRGCPASASKRQMHRWLPKVCCWTKEARQYALFLFYSFGVLFILHLYELKKGPKQSSVRELWAVVTPVKDTGEVSKEWGSFLPWLMAHGCG